MDDALRRTEEAINAALSEVRQSRSNFRSAAGAGQNQKPAGTIGYISQDEMNQ